MPSGHQKPSAASPQDFKIYGGVSRYLRYFDLECIDSGIFFALRNPCYTTDSRHIIANQRNLGSSRRGKPSDGKPPGLCLRPGRAVSHRKPMGAAPKDTTPIDARISSPHTDLGKHLPLPYRPRRRHQSSPPVSRGFHHRNTNRPRQLRGELRPVIDGHKASS